MRLGLNPIAAVLLAGCAASQSGSPFPDPISSSPVERAIRSQLPPGPIGECQFDMVLTRYSNRTPWLESRIQISLPSTYELTQPMAQVGGARGQYLGGQYGPVWDWAPGIGLPPLRAYTDLRRVWTEIVSDRYVVQVMLTGSSGYPGFAPAEGWSLTDLQECGTWAENRPIRVLLFRVVGPTAQDPVYYGVSAFWRPLIDGWATLLGLSTHPEAQAEFLSILRTSR